MAKSPKPAKGKPKAKAAAPKRVSNKSTARALKKTDKRGTPKGKGTVRTKTGARIGNPKFQPTEEQRQRVLSHAAVATHQEIIAEELGISADTLHRHFRKELDQGLARANARLGGVLYKGALAGDAKKLEMWFDRRGGPDWQKKTGVQLSGPNGAPIEYRDLSDEEIEARIAALTSRAAAADE